MATTEKATEKILHSALRVLNGKRKDAICQKSGLGMEALQHVASDLLPLIDLLDERKRELLYMRYGLDGKGPRTLQELGDFYGVTRERTRQLQNAALRKLRKTLERRTFAQ